MKNKWLWAAVAVIALWFFWQPARHAADTTWNAFARIRVSPPPPADLTHHTYRSVPLRIRFVPDAATHNRYGHITETPWGGGDLCIPRESPTIRGSVVANGTRVHVSRLRPRTCPAGVDHCEFTFEPVVEFADNSTHLEISLDEILPGSLHCSGVSPIARVSRPVVNGGLIPGNPNYSHIRVRGGQLFIEPNGDVNEAVASAP